MTGKVITYLSRYTLISLAASATPLDPQTLIYASGVNWRISSTTIGLATRMSCGARQARSVSQTRHPSIEGTALKGIPIAAILLPTPSIQVA